MLLFQLIALHALCDYSLQTDFLAKGKNHTSPIPGIPWQYCLLAHALIHGLAVAVVTDSSVLGIAETVIHAATDYAKCDGRINFHADQVIHVACKVAWVALCF